MTLTPAEIQGLRAVFTAYAARAFRHGVTGTEVIQAVVENALRGSGLSASSVEGITLAAKLHTLMKDIA